MKTTNIYSLSKHLFQLLLEEPFFASISRVVPKIADSNIPTAQVRIEEDGNYIMSYNPEWFSTLSDAETLSVLKHELYHIIFEHLAKRIPTQPKSISPGDWGKIRNIAMDLSINAHLSDLPLTPSGEPACKPGFGAFKEYPDKQSMEFYLKMLLSQCEDSGVPAAGMVDEHSEPSSDAQKLAKERMKNVITQALEDCDRAEAFGSLSSGVKKDLIRSFNSEIDWKKVLRYFVKTSQNANKMSSIKKINRRYPYIHSGRKTSRTANIAVSIDQSYSVDDEMLGKFYDELNKLSDIAEFTVVPFDSRVAEDKVYTWRKGENKKTERVLGGGTCFDAPTEYVNNKGFDGHIVLTDLCAPKPKASKCQRMWITTQKYASKPYFTTNERIIAIN